MAETLSADQNAAVRAALSGRNVFITGPGGVGKSVTVRHIVRELRMAGKEVHVVAPTGVAAINVNGTTIHSWAGIKLGEKPAPEYVAAMEGDLDTVRYRDSAFKRIVTCDVLVIDEISMVSAGMFAKIEIICRLAREAYAARDFLEYLDMVADLEEVSGALFGGIQLIVSGDFLQLPPVDTKEKAKTMPCWACGHESKRIKQTRDFQCLHATLSKDCGRKWDHTERYAFEPDPIGVNRWDLCRFSTHELTEVRRQRDPVFIGMLHRLRVGRLTASDVVMIKELERPLDKTADGVIATRLYPHRSSATATNRRYYRKLDGPEYVYDADDRCSGPSGEYILTQLRKNVQLDEKVLLKTGTQVLLRSNLDLPNGLANGTRGVVVGFCNVNSKEECDKWGVSGEVDKSLGAVLPVVSFVTAHKDNIRKLIQPIVFTTERKHLDSQASRKQIPLSWSWAITIHKAQGMTLSYVSMSLEECFDDGQVYVAVSRAESRKGLSIESFDETKVKASEKIVRFYDQAATAPKTADSAYKRRKVDE